MRHALLDIVDDALDHLKLVQEGHRVLDILDLRASHIILFIEKTTGGVAQLNDEDVLFDAGFDA